jgi:hypothetical protein
MGHYRMVPGRIKNARTNGLRLRSETCLCVQTNARLDGLAGFCGQRSWQAVFPASVGGRRFLGRHPRLAASGGIPRKDALNRDVNPTSAGIGKMPSPPPNRVAMRRYDAPSARSRRILQ